jgi:hypothetical protein
MDNHDRLLDILGLAVMSEFPSISNQVSLVHAVSRAPIDFTKRARESSV